MTEKTPEERQKELDNRLRKVVTGNDIKKIKILLDNGANPNIIYGGKNDILKTVPILIIIAGWYSSPKTIRLLLEAGADVNIQDTYGQTPLIVAISSNVWNINNVKILLDNKEYLFCVSFVYLSKFFLRSSALFSSPISSSCI